MSTEEARTVDDSENIGSATAIGIRRRDYIRLRLVFAAGFVESDQ